mgnify:CR=1 FL=1
MKDKEYIKQVLIFQMNHLANELAKCKFIYDHADDYDFYTVPVADFNDLPANKILH